MDAQLEAVLARAETDFDKSVSHLCAFLRIPSIGTDPAHDADTRQAGSWVVDRLTAIGFTAALHETGGQPAVVAHYPGPAGYKGPHLLYYGHYDVQPADPLELWTSPPFDPVTVQGPHGPRIVARGAVDDKGQMTTWMEAMSAWHAVHGQLPARITILAEGEEESGSRSLQRFLENNRDKLSADIAIVSDTNSWDIETPTITYTLRGLVYTEVTLTGPERDLHSGMFGGAVLNPNTALARILVALHDSDGRVQVPGFYDEVAEIAPAERAAWDGLHFDEAAWLGGIGLKTPWGETGRSGLERQWSRPTCDVNGMWGGYTGDGAKTVIPSAASAKVSFRLVPNQDPARIFEGFRQFIAAHCPPDFTFTLTEFAGSPGIRVPTTSPYLQAALAGLGDVYSKSPVLIGSGGSIPVVGMMQKVLGIDSILVGFGLDDDRVHSPNEKFELKCLSNGIRAHAAILARLSDLPRAG